MTALSTSNLLKNLSESKRKLSAVNIGPKRISIGRGERLNEYGKFYEGKKMSTREEKLAAIRYALEAARKLVAKLEAIESVSKLHRTQQYELDMARHTVKLGEQVLKEASSEKAVT